MVFTNDFGLDFKTSVKKSLKTRNKHFAQSIKIALAELLKICLLGFVRLRSSTWRLRTTSVVNVIMQRLQKVTSNHTNLKQSPYKKKPAALIS